MQASLEYKEIRKVGSNWGEGRWMMGIIAEERERLVEEENEGVSLLRFLR